ncbi:hypothetical protein AGMMS50268_10590 [Spirochaetia bacterium]|nr:hypothetical protein AGMMS50268_10590 [Spirochaetia bacterium]
MPKIPHLAFKKEYTGLTLNLITDVVISGFPGGSGISVRALWDTGADGSAITPKVAQSLNLKPIDKANITGANESSMVDVVEISVILPNKVRVGDVRVTVCNLNGGIDMLLGMDIIMLGDFSISNGDGITLFSFAVPPFQNKVDLYEKAIAVNRRNKA